MTGLQDRLRSNEASARALEDRKAYLEAQLNLMEKSITATVTDNGQTLSVYAKDPSQSLEHQLALKRAKFTGLISKYTPRHPTEVVAREKVADLEKRIAEIQRSAPGPADGKPQGDALLASATSPSY